MNEFNAAEICTLMSHAVAKETTALDSDPNLKLCLKYVFDNFTVDTYRIALIVAREATDSQALHDYLNDILKDIKNG